MPSKLFVYGQDLPEPFDNLTSATVDVRSKYSDATQKAKLSNTVTNAVLAFCRCSENIGAGGVGLIDQRSVAEYCCESDEDEMHLVVYDSTSGGLMTSVYDKNVETITEYKVGRSARNGAAIAFAIMPFLLEDAEFAEKMDEFQQMYKDGFPNVDDATKVLGVLCDNAFRRIEDSSNPAHVKVNIPNTGNINRLTKMQLDSGQLEPRTVTAGEFTIFSAASVVSVSRPAIVINHGDLFGKYRINDARVYTDRETSLIPFLPPWYVTPEEVVDVCEHIKMTTDKFTPMRNIMYRGPAGTGKTMGAKAVSAGLYQPYLKITCSANMEISDFVGQVFPEVSAADIAELREEMNVLTLMGGVTDENIVTLMKLPGEMDMRYDPESAFRQLTGNEKADASEEDCIAARKRIISSKARQLKHLEDLASNVGQKFTYVKTDFIKALECGYVVEIQEPNTIVQPGVLVGLNSMLEQGGSITLPTGEIIKRHPEAVVIVTTNVNYEGCRGMNQSVTDRMNLVLDIELPAKEVMVGRAMSVTGCEDDVMVTKMVEVVDNISSYCRDNGITDGSCGMRSLIDWILSTETKKDPYKSALMTVISKATADPDDRYSLITTILEPIFPKPARAA